MHKLILTGILGTAIPAMAVEIEMDYSHDEAADQFFSSNPQAQSAVDKAAEDLSRVLTNTLEEIAQDVFIGTNGSTTAQFDWNWTYRNPVTGATEIINEPRAGTDVITVYAGTRNLGGLTLGQGGAGGAGFTISGSGLPSEWIGAVDNAEAISNAIMSRGSGPTLGTISGSANFSGFIGRYDLDFGIAVGNLWFDADRDNNGVRDSDAALADSWHYDAFSPVTAGKTDLYTVALHELMHTLGAGTSQTWQDLVDGNDWLGTEAAAVAGTATILEDDGAHLRHNILSPRLSDGVLQEAVLAPSITPGVRKELTELDLAILVDLGYSIGAPVPEPSTFSLIVFAALIATCHRRKRK